MVILEAMGNLLNKSYVQFDDKESKEKCLNAA